MAIATRQDMMGVYTDIEHTELYPASKLVERLSGMQVQNNKAIVGRNAFRHSSGIHQDGVLKMRETYEIMSAESVGQPTGESIVLTKVSGRHGLSARLQDLGVDLESIDLDKVFAAFKDVADRKDEVDDRDLMAIISEHTSLDVDELWKLDLVQVSTTDHGRPTATVRLVNSSDEVFEDAAVGEGPVDAIYNAVNRVTGAENTLTEYSVKSVTEGIDAQGEVTIRIESNGHSYMGRAADPDILVASTRAYIYAMNRSLNDQMAS
jgi:2-isopropylmalate synthase